MSILSIRGVTKRYRDHVAVDNVSFEMPKGTILGLLGPNGAGKTSLIRIITTITKADAGEVLFDGERLNSYHPGSIGYLPEERGLYKKMKVGEHLIYLATLKGLEETVAKQKIDVWMERFEMTDWWDKKVNELSKGMQQKVQFVSTIVHEPKLIILDEPFSGLDPINTNLIKEEIGKLQEKGMSVIFSTHRMEQVEEVCKDIVLINNGQNILTGSVAEIKDAYKDNVFQVRFIGDLPSEIAGSPSIQEVSENHLLFASDSLSDANNFIKRMLEMGMQISGFEEILPTLNEIFIKKVTAENE
ncbi:MAG: ATP-binding cassette domain-containing protein [Saprospiraceae bacterium]|nr:ATP-binding cassette domain-containing protein [Saprospiraceae bacterium]